MEKKENLVKQVARVSKPFDELTFTDNFIFTRVMEANPDLCIKLTELVTGRKVSKMKMETLGKEHTVKLTPDSKGIRLDVYFEDSEAMYDIEMQTSNQSDLGKRFRYYQGMTDIATLGTGQLYRELPQSYIVFLCTFDAFNRGRVKYEFRNLCVSEPDIELGDETCKIAVCAFGKEVDGNNSLNALLSYMRDGSMEDDFVRKLDKATEDAKRSAENRREYMSYEMDRLIYGDEREAKGRAEGHAEGKAEGRAEGKAEGHAEGRQDQLFDLVLKGLLPLSVAAEEAGLDQEAFEKAMAEYKAEHE